MTLYLAPGRPFTLPGRTVLLGSGAAGWVFGVPDDPRVCFKVYLRPSAELDRRVAGLLRLRPVSSRPDGYRIAWPEWPLVDETDRTRAIVLPRVPGVALHSIFDPVQRIAVLDHPIWPTCIELALRIARLFANLHDDRQVVVGDVSPDNLIVSRIGTVALIDTDSMQFTDPYTGEFFLARHMTPGYTAPETLAAPPSALRPSHDLFGLAVLVCQLLLEGDHPFEGVLRDGGDHGVDSNVAAGNCRLFFPERFRTAAGRLPRELLPPPVLALAHRGLADGHARPELRPTAKEWVGALTAALNSLIGCRVNSRHFSPASLGDCLWCGRRASGGEHYPDPVLAESDQPTGGPAGRQRRTGSGAMRGRTA
jgi:DNA-binding helix-hairpin-helix protein with protein kinase domain